jgi:uridylate kinase
MYKRVLLKLSGEQLQGKYDGGGFDTERAVWIANEIKKVQDNVQIVIMVGGGNYVRGAQIAGGGIDEDTAHNMGMLATVINAMALGDVLNAHGVPARTLSTIKADQVVDQFTSRRAISHLEKNRVVVMGGGSSRPFFTTDTGAVQLALELKCDAILKATKVDGVYDSDPTTNPNAKKFETLELHEAVKHPEIKVMDNSAMAMASDNDQSIVVFELLKEGNIARAIAGEHVGTVVTA